MTIPFTKAHGARNDFLLSWAHQAPVSRLPEIAIAICDRHTGIGADGWMLVRPPDDEAYASIRLFNSDGSDSEISGNGTRCAAAFLVDFGMLPYRIPIVTGAGLRNVSVVEREDNRYMLGMDMGQPKVLDRSASLLLRDGSREAVILNVGNPQCALLVDNFAFPWTTIGEEIESHSMFPQRTNVSFFRIVDRHTIDVRFYERGAGVTMSSGTGSTGAAAAAFALGLVDSPVTVLTPAGPLALRWEGDSIHLIGPAEITARGEYYLEL